MAERGARPAFYALRTGGWRDYWTLLHPPYTLWHLSYVGLGAAVAPVLDWRPLLAVAVAFFLGVGITAHALDELNGRPLQTAIPDAVLWVLAVAGLLGAVGIGFLGAAVVSWWLVLFIAFGAFIVAAYNLESFGGAFHNGLWFAVGWGAFPALTAYFAQTETIRVEAVLVAAGCAALSLVQRVLSTPVRMLRRRTRSASGQIVLDDGEEIDLTEDRLRAVPEGALRILSAAVVFLALGAIVGRLASF